MDLSELSFSTIKKLERMKEDANERLDHVEVVYKSRKNILYNVLISEDYLVLDADRETKELFGYAYYNATDKLLGTSVDKILMDIVGHDKAYILKNKVISITDVPNDYESCFEALDDADGYFDKVDIGNGKFRKALDMHGFTIGTGTNGIYSSGTEKLSRFCSSYNDYQVIEILTGKSKEENDRILLNVIETSEIKKIFDVAEEHGYEVSKTEG